VGVAQAALDAAVKYTATGRSFGQASPIFQGLRWIVADMAVEVGAAAN